MTVELLLARCPEVEVLQRLARAYNISEPRFPKSRMIATHAAYCVRIQSGAYGVSRGHPVY